MAGLYFVGIILFVVNVIGQQTDFNCNQLPPVTPDVKNCCKRPTINLDKYKSQCYNATVSTRFGSTSPDSNAFMNPCAVECIYTQGGALINGRFNMPNLKTLLLEIMPNNAELANVFFAGFQKCGPETQKKIQEMEANQLANGIKQKAIPCSPFAVLATFCAMRHTFINCPASLWTSSDACIKAQNFLKNCEPMQFGGPNNARTGQSA